MVSWHQQQSLFQVSDLNFVLGTTFTTPVIQNFLADPAGAGHIRRGDN
jgi:hypothetical protein